MFSVEMDHDEIEITVMDDYGHNEDLKVNLFDDVIYIRQYNEVTDRDELIQISPEMWDELVAAIHSPEGVFRTVKK